MGEEFTIYGNNRRKVDTSFLPGQTKINTNNLNLDTSGLRPQSYTTRPYTGVTQNYRSMVPQQNRVNTNNLNLDTSGLKPVKSMFTPEQVRNAGISRSKFSVAKNTGEKYDGRWLYQGQDTVSGNEALEKGMFNNDDYLLRRQDWDDDGNPEMKSNAQLMYEYPEHMSRILNGDQMSQSEINDFNEAFPNNTTLKPGNKWNYDNTKAYLSQLYSNNSNINDKNINTVMSQLNNPRLKNTLNQNSWNKIQSGADQFLTNYDAVQAFKNRAANGTAFGRRSTSTNQGL